MVRSKGWDVRWHIIVDRGRSNASVPIATANTAALYEALAAAYRAAYRQAVRDRGWGEVRE
jgi:hypothetical protein